MTISTILWITFAFGAYIVCALGVYRILQKADIPFSMSSHPVATSIIVSGMSVLWPAALGIALTLKGFEILFPGEKGQDQ